MNRALVRIGFGLVLSAMCAAVLAEQSHPWKTGTVISQKLTAESNTVYVISGAHSYVWQEIARNPESPHYIVLVQDPTFHDQVKYYRDGHWFVILDDQGEKHRFRLMRAATNE